jgi:hypothetical protein
LFLQTLFSLCFVCCFLVNRQRRSNKQPFSKKSNLFLKARGRATNDRQHSQAMDEGRHNETRHIKGGANAAKLKYWERLPGRTTVEVLTYVQYSVVLSCLVLSCRVFSSHLFTLLLLLFVGQFTLFQEDWPLHMIMLLTWLHSQIPIQRDTGCVLPFCSLRWQTVSRWMGWETDGVDTSFAYIAALSGDERREKESRERRTKIGRLHSFLFIHVQRIVPYDPLPHCRCRRSKTLVIRFFYWSWSCPLSFPTLDGDTIRNKVCQITLGPLNPKAKPFVVEKSLSPKPSLNWGQGLLIKPQPQAVVISPPPSVVSTESLVELTNSTKA